MWVGIGLFIAALLFIWYAIGCWAPGKANKRAEELQEEANAKKCDRCGEFYQECAVNAIEQFVNDCKTAFSPWERLSPAETIETMLDLCPSCSKSLRRWLKGCEGEELLGEGKEDDK